MAHDVEHDQVKKIFMEVGELVNFYFCSTRHLAVVEYSSEEAAENAVYLLTGCYLTGRPLKLQLLSLNMHTSDLPSLGENLPSLGKKLPSHPSGIVCVKGFDSALEIGTIRNMLKEHFEYKGPDKVVTPVNSDNTSTGKAYIRYEVLSSFRSALQLHGSKLGGHQLSVTEWPEIHWGTPWRGKRTIIKYEDGDD